MKESAFQKSLKDEIKARFPGCVFLKNDPNYIQGFPDITVLFGKLWAVLEVKGSEKASKRPNQSYYIERLARSGFAAFVSPENKNKILNELENYFCQEF